MRSRVRRYDVELVFSNGLVTWQAEFSASLASMKARCEYWWRMPQVVEVAVFSERGVCLFRYDGRAHAAATACVF